MRFKIRHEIEYRYSKPVYLEPHSFYLKPRENPSQRLIFFDFSVDPAPKLISRVIDSLGNDSHKAWFEGETDYLRISSHSEVIVDRPNPFDYLMDPAISRLPAQYNPATTKALRPYLEDFEVVLPAVSRFSCDIGTRAGTSIPLVLPELTRTLFESFERITRPEGEPWPAVQTLESKKGSCRDLTVLFIECCRAQGLAARFTSGYFEGDPALPEKDLHAWAEVYVEGGGWRGFDPTTGLAISDSYVAIASANEPALISPVIGTFRGDASSTMRATVEMKRVG